MVALDYPAIGTTEISMTSPTASVESGTTQSPPSSTAPASPNEASKLLKNKNADNINNHSKKKADNCKTKGSSASETNEECSSTSTFSQIDGLVNCDKGSNETSNHGKDEKEKDKPNPKDNNQTVKSPKNLEKTSELTKKGLSLNLNSKELEELISRTPKSPILSRRIQPPYSHQGSVDLEDRKSLREALYQGIFLRHRKTIFAMGSFLKLLRNRNSHYNSMRCSSEGEDIDKVR